MRTLRLAGRRSPQQASLRTRVAADIGGTFTDIAAFDERTGRLLLGKALSTPARLVDGISHGMEKAGARFADAEAFLHASTIAINTMLERTGAKTALLATERFRDIYEIGRINRPDADNLYFKKHVPLVGRALRFEVRERITAEGEMHAALDEASVRDESRQARTECVRMLESGPAAGVIGAQALCTALGLSDAVAFEMGGTTAKAGVIYRGKALTTGAALIGG